MNPRIQIASIQTPSGGVMTLYQHGRDFSILVDGHALMESRQHESELALARLGLAHLAGQRTPRILIGGLGMGYTLRQALDLLPAGAGVVVGELMAALVEWNRSYFGERNGHPLRDDRVDLRTGDVIDLISQSPGQWDAILLDIDNGPGAMTDSRNTRLYDPPGIDACRRALRENGCLAVWSAAPCNPFEQRLMQCDFHVRRYRIPAYAGSKAKSRFIWVASEDKDHLPPGGGEPRRPQPKKPKPRHRTRGKTFRKKK